MPPENLPSAVPIDIAIEVKGVSKRFKLYHNIVTGPVKELLFFWKREHYYKDFMAVSNVSLTVQRGEVVGIIGPNGAGKTTLLKMIAGLLPVEAGTINVRGKVTALLALGVGIHPEFTGRENIYYGGLLLGMSKKEIIEKTPAIIEFAELGKFIDRPFRTYSAGMRARLLFAISMSIDPDILIVDEALATGDAYFVQKCGQRIRELCQSGATVLFVSHNLSQIQDICNRACFMAEGRVVAEGAPSEMVAAYNQWIFGKEKNRGGEPTSSRFLPLTSGSGRVEITEVRLKNDKDEIVNGYYSGDSLILEIDYSSKLPSSSEVTFFIGIIRASDHQWVGEICTNYILDSFDSEVRDSPVELFCLGTIQATMTPLLLLNNHYYFWIMLYDKEERYCEYRPVAPFFVARRAHLLDRDPVFWQPCRIKTMSRDAG